MTAPSTQVERVATESALGPFRAAYRGRFRMSVAVLLLIAAACAAAALAAGDPTMTLLLLSLGSPALVFAIWLGWWEFRHSGDRVYLYDGGLVHQSRRGTVTAFPWPAISEVREQKLTAEVQNIPVRKIHFVEVRRGDGVGVVLNNRFRGVAALGDEVVRRASQVLLDGARAAVNAGRRVDFDRLSVDRDGIARGNHRVPWREARELSVDYGIVFTRVRIRTTTKRLPVTWRLFPSRPFPNLRVLMALAAHLLPDA